ELEDMKKRLKEIEEEAGPLREMQAKVDKEMGSVQGMFTFPRWELEAVNSDSDELRYGFPLLIVSVFYYSAWICTADFVRFFLLGLGYFFSRSMDCRGTLEVASNEAAMMVIPVKKKTGSATSVHIYECVRWCCGYVGLAGFLL
ncbi:hypothetical protein M8C21_026777, partial [Ambrosia artemisiifolia]